MRYWNDVELMCGGEHDEELMRSNYILPEGKLFRVKDGDGIEIKSAKTVELGRPTKISGLYFYFNVDGIDIITMAGQILMKATPEPQIQAYVVAVSASGPDKAEV